ncbi:Rrf2 family transcriptional regulator [uncultured Jatrophihabitans sp.]|uniref:Rrf2 family transcriptional regulator n=1 Tax=uncultured Jatrophihabitans sp. TaxID=1610747 RepID=UPI0035C9A3E9
MPAPTNTQFAVAVHVLVYLADADPGTLVNSDELSRSANANPVYVRRVLGPLREAGIVRSRPGVGGGWELARAAGSVALDEVWSVVNGDDPVLGLHGPNPSCPIGRGVQRALTDLDRQAERALRDVLGQRTVGDVLAATSVRPRRGARRTDGRRA